MFRPNTLFFAKIGRKNRVAVVFRSLVFSSKNWMLDFFFSTFSLVELNTHITNNSDVDATEQDTERSLTISAASEKGLSLSLSPSLSLFLSPPPLSSFHSEANRASKKLSLVVTTHSSCNDCFLYIYPPRKLFPRFWSFC